MRRNLDGLTIWPHELIVSGSETIAAENSNYILHASKVALYFQAIFLVSLCWLKKSMRASLRMLNKSEVVLLDEAIAEACKINRGLV